MPSKLIEEILHLGHNRYACGSDEDAVKLAHEDLVSAPDQLHSPPLICKMYATDVLRQAAMWAPTLITSQIIDDCQRVFPNCNDSSRLNIIAVFGLLRCTDAVPYLEQVRDDSTRPNITRVVREDGRVAMKAIRDDSQPDWVHAAAVEALQVIRGQIEIAIGQTPGRWIYTFNPDQR